jgi:hypothetical protein
MRYLGIGAISAAVLLLELTLTLVYSVTQGYHFAFLAVSLGFLGFGASGTALFAGRPLLIRKTAVLLPVSSFLFAMAALGTYWAINMIPFDIYRLVVDQGMISWMMAFYIVQIVPFFFAGLVLGGSLVADPTNVHRIYGSSLAGSGIGSLLALGWPSSVGPNGAIAAVTLLGSLTFAILILKRTVRSVIVTSAVVAVLLAGGLLVPRNVVLNVSPHKALPQLLLQKGAQLQETEWNSFSRIDVVSSETLHQAPGLSFSYSGGIPPQQAVTLDADNATTMTTLREEEEANFTEYLPVASAFEILSVPSVLIVEPGGGLDILTTLHHGAGDVTALSSNPIAAELLRDNFHSEIDAGILEVVAGNPRSFLSRSNQKFDLVIISLTDSFRPVRSGAFSLSENHVYTGEAFNAYFNHLSPGGILVATRWVQVPPSEGMRVIATVVEVLTDRTGISVENKIAALRTLQTITIFARNDDFQTKDLDSIRRFTASRQMDLSYIPGIRANELNQHFVLPQEIYFQGITQLLDESRREYFYTKSEFDVVPTSDDRPFFFHFFKWRQLPDVVNRIGQTFDAFGGAGFLIVLLFLGVAVLVSSLLILLPLAIIRTPSEGDHGALGSPSQWISVGYFFTLGLAFLWIELPLMQRFILLLDYPAYSFGIVLFTILVFSGIGSILSSRLGAIRSWAPLALSIVAVLYGLGFVPPTDFALGFPLTARVAVAIASIAPIAILMGIPFPLGIRAIETTTPSLVPWAWGVNGCASVVGSILAIVITLELGYAAAMMAAGIGYGFAWVLLRVGLWSSITARERTERTAPVPGFSISIAHRDAQ